MRGLGNTHGVSINRLKEAFDEPWNELVKEDTTSMAGDIFTKAFDNKDKWAHACRMINMYDMNDLDTAPRIAGGEPNGLQTKQTNAKSNAKKQAVNNAAPAKVAKTQKVQHSRAGIPKPLNDWRGWHTYHTPRSGETRVVCPRSAQLHASLPPLSQWTGRRRIVGQFLNPTAGPTTFDECDDWLEVGAKEHPLWKGHLQFE